MHRIFLIFLIIFCLLGCTPVKQDNDKNLHYYSGEVVSIVQQKERISNQLQMEYTLTLINFKPIGEEFEIYNSQFPFDMEERHIEITKDTKLFTDQGNRREEISIEELIKGDKVSFYIEIIDGYYLAATELIKQ